MCSYNVIDLQTKCFVFGLEPREYFKMVPQLTDKLTEIFYDSGSDDKTFYDFNEIIIILCIKYRQCPCFLDGLIVLKANLFGA